nr:MAG TPA: hypothetical protein [Caudoviricetes sp.]
MRCRRNFFHRQKELNHISPPRFLYFFSFAFSFYLPHSHAKSKLGDRVTGLQGAGAKPPCSCSCSSWTSGTFS